MAVLSYKTISDIAATGAGTIEGYASVFDVQDEGNDIVRPGAYLQSIADCKALVRKGQQTYLLPMLWQHDQTQPIGGWTSLEEDSYGLKCTGQILLSIPNGQQAYEVLKADVVRSFSIGYDVMPNGAYYEKGARNLTNLRLWEISVVTFPMCLEATVSSVKRNRHLIHRF